MEKRKKRNGRGVRWIAALLLSALLAGALSGCGGSAPGGDGAGEGGAGGDGAKSGAEGSKAADGGSPGQDGKGRYVEIQESLPEELDGWSIVQIYTADGKLRLLATKAEGDKAVLREGEKQEEGLTDVTQGWLADMEFRCIGGWLDVRLCRKSSPNSTK